MESGLRIDGDARRYSQLRLKENNYLVAAVNNGDLQLFQY